MVTGTYTISLKTPLGLKKGELTLKDEGGVLTGTMSALGKEQPIEAGSCSGDAFSFSGSLKTAAGRLAYSCEGTVEGDTLAGVAKTKKGDLVLKGTRKA